MRTAAGIALAGVAAVLLGARVAVTAPPAVPPLRLSRGDLTLGIAPELGGRIVELRLRGGDNLLDADPRFWAEPPPPPSLDTPFAPWNGHTYWVGPQSAWWMQQDLDPARRRSRATWPPDPFHETARYVVRERSASRAVLECGASLVTGLRRRLDVELLDARRVRVRVAVTNARKTAVAWSVYSNTRVRPEGWAYVRLAPDGVRRIDAPRTGPAYPHRVEGGFFVFPPGVTASPGAAPLTADVYLRPAEPRIAYFLGGMLLLKSMRSFSPSRLHPEETLVELYRSSGGASEAALLELELHGPYETLAPGKSTSFEETWEIVDYPGAAEPAAHLAFLSRLAANR